jgi:hypothetical protein
MQVRVAALLIATTLAASAGAEPPPVKDWEVEITPYGWVPDLDAEVETNRRGTEHFHVGMDDVLENLDVAAMGRVSARWHRWVGVVDVAWSVLEAEDAFERGRLRASADVRETMTLAQALGGYRLFARPGGLFGNATAGDARVFGFDVLAGANYTYVSTSVEFDRDPLGPIAGRDRHFGSSDDWFAPAVGVRVQNDFSERLRLETLASAGGFGVGDAPDVSWTVTTLLSYRFTEHFVVSAGHRLVTVDGDRGELRMHGPMIGLGFRF